MRIINPTKYDYLLKGHAPCNYGLASTTMYRTLDIKEERKGHNQIEGYYKYEYDNFKIDWAFRTFESEDDINYNILLVTNKGIFRDTQTRTIYDETIYMRWTTFVSKIDDRKPGLIVTTVPGSKVVQYFYPLKITNKYFNQNNELCKLVIMDTNGLCHTIRATVQLINALNNCTDYIDIEETNFIPVYHFNMWYMMF